MDKLFQIHVPGTTLIVNVVPSQQAIHFAAQAILSGDMDVVMAGGVEKYDPDSNGGISTKNLT